MFLSGKEDCNTLGPISCGKKICTVGDRTQCLVGVGVCETASLKYVEVSPVGLSRRPMDAYKQGTVGINVKRIFCNAPCQDIVDNFIGSPTG